MAKAYVIAQVDVHDSEAYESYRAGTPASIARFGGRFIVRGGPMETLEGEAPYRRVVVIEFPSTEQARQWYQSDEYTALRAIRQSAASSSLILLAGV